MHQPVDDTPSQPNAHLVSDLNHRLTQREARTGVTPFHARGQAHTVFYTDSQPLQVAGRYPALIYPTSFRKIRGPYATV
jgi:hypothetical protein